MFSQTAEYALRAMVCLATNPGEPMSCDAIALVTKAPQGYLSKVLRDLAVAGLILSQRGRHGGFTLARRPSEVSILDIVDAVDPIQRIHACPLGNPAHTQLCPLHARMDSAIQMIRTALGASTLEELKKEAESGGPIAA